MKRKHIDVKPKADLDVQLGLLWAMLDDGTREWREELGEVSQEAIGWQAFPDGHSIGGVLLHMADVEAFWIQECAAGLERSPEELKMFLSEETQQHEVRWPAPPQQPLTWYFEQHDAIRKKTQRIVRELGDPEHLGYRPDYQFTLRWILHHVLTHEAYHGGQAVLLALQFPHRG